MSRYCCDREDWDRLKHLCPVEREAERLRSDSFNFALNWNSGMCIPEDIDNELMFKVKVYTAEYCKQNPKLGLREIEKLVFDRLHEEGLIDFSHDVAGDEEDL